MTASAFALHLAFCTCLAAQSAAIVWAMTRVGVIDTPGSRSSHTHPTPKGGGVGIVAAFLTGIAALYFFASFSRLADPYFRGRDFCRDRNCDCGAPGRRVGVAGSSKARDADSRCRPSRCEWTDCSRNTRARGWRNRARLAGFCWNVGLDCHCDKRIELHRWLERSCCGRVSDNVSLPGCNSCFGRLVVRLLCGINPSGRAARIPAIQFPPRPYLYGGCRQSVLWLYARSSCHRCWPV